MSSSSQTEIRHIRPYVHYHCGCPDVNKSSVSLETENGETFNINSPRIQFSTFSISKLYFCDDCHQIRCPRCVQEEIVCYYCPNCLFEVPTASVKSERNRCARNCFQCPICQNTLSVLPSSEPQPPPSPISPTTVPTVSATGAPYYLSCGVCRWDSQEIGMTFEKATGLALQLQKTEDERPDVKEFDHLKDHFEKHIRLNTPSTALPSSLLSIPGMSSFSSRYGGTVANSQQKSDDVVPYEAVAKVETESGLVDDLVQLKDVNQITTLSQRMNQLSDQPYKVERLQPQRIHLRTKRVKRCRSCRHILIKPEQKAQATRFKIKLVALNSIPKITIASLPKLILNQRTQIVLKFSNPLYEEISVNLAIQEETNECGKVTILAPHFNITPYNEVWEYDEQDLVASRSRTASNSIGIYERRGNSTSIMFEITPLAEVEEFKFPLLVTYTSKNIENNENENVTAVEKSLEETSSLKATSGEPATDGSTKTLSFWTVIGLGSVIKAPPGTSGTMVAGPRSEPSGSSKGSTRGSTGGSSSVRK
ncbi:dynactin p62 family-domain-containing protein [Glomus cerebriforme]|uniref:Dynactin subunit 4 n=1 Tax=Glomus cerebriforme TaxID=658196 RepID=A0A397TES5_9GLOM|nr:dynactin p62 family-domain-containing protein [Glomus cerebriforme]